MQLLLTACSGSAPAAAPASTVPASSGAAGPSASGLASVSAPVAASAAKPSASPKLGGTLRLGIVGDLTSLDGQVTLPATNNTVGLAYEPLTRYGPNLQPQPVLATNWDVSSDAKQITLNLRKGVTFHDGRELTSDDVKYSWTRMKDPKVAALVGTTAVQSLWFSSVDTPDKYTVVFNSTVPRPGVFDFLQYFTIVDKNLMETPAAASKANGTGPLKLVEWVQGDHVTMTKNKNYWQPGVPYIDGMEIKIYRDSQALVAGLEAGALDVIDAPPLVDLIRLKSDPKYQPLVVADSGQFISIVANCGAPPTDNKLFRQAINFAMNRPRFVDSYFKGVISDWTDLPFPQSSPAYDAAKSKAYPFNLEKAKALIAQSGVTNTDMDLTYSSTQYGDQNLLFGQILQADLASIGVKLTLKPVDFATQVDVATKRSYKGLLISTGSGALLGEPTSLLTRSRFFMPDPKTSWTGLDDPRYSQAVAAGSSEPDATKRKAYYGQILDAIVDDSATIVVSLYPSTAIARPNVHGLVYDSRPALTYPSAWLD